MSKQDRQGVRTPAQLEQKYSFGNDQKAVAEMRKLAASFAKEASDMHRQMASIEAKLKTAEALFMLVPIVGAGGAWTLSGVTYADLKSAWDAGRCIALYANQGDGSCRYYHCMGLDASAALVFQYGFGSAVQYVTVGADGVSVETLAAE